MHERVTFDDLDIEQQSKAFEEYQEATGDRCSFAKFVSAVALEIDWDKVSGKPWPYAVRVKMASAFIPTKQRKHRCRFCGKGYGRTIVPGGWAHKRCANAQIFPI